MIVEKESQIMKKPIKKRTKRMRWTQKSYEELVNYVKKYGRKWKFISSFYQNVSPKQIFDKYYLMTSKDKYKFWTKEQDQTLLDYIKVKGVGHWEEFDHLISNKTKDHCKWRWENILNPKIKKGKWEVKEQIIYMQCILNKGFDLKYLSIKLVSRPELNIKNFFESAMQFIRKSPFFNLIDILFIKPNESIQGN